MSSLLLRMKNIASLKENQTIDSHGNIQDLGWFTTYSRWNNSESHVTTCGYLEALTDEIVTMWNAHMNIDTLYEAIPGFIEGIKTYIRTTSCQPYAAYVSNRLSISIGKLERCKIIVISPKQEILVSEEEKKESTKKESEVIDIYVPLSDGEEIGSTNEIELCISPEKEKEGDKNLQEMFKSKEEKIQEIIDEGNRILEKRNAINTLRYEILELTREREYVLREKNRLQKILKRKIRENMKNY